MTGERLRSGAYESDVSVAPPAASVHTAPAERAGPRRFILGEHPVAELSLGVAGLAAVSAWFGVALLIYTLATERHEPEGTSGPAIAVLMPVVVFLAFGFTSIAASIWRNFWGAGVSRLVAVACALAAVIVPLAWVAVVFS